MLLFHATDGCQTVDTNTQNVKDNDGRIGALAALSSLYLWPSFDPCCQAPRILPIDNLKNVYIYLVRIYFGRMSNVFC